MSRIAVIALSVASLFVLAGGEYLRMQPGSGSVDRPVAAMIR